MVQNCNYLFYNLISQNAYIIGSVVLLALLGRALFQRVEGTFEHVLVGVILGAAGINLIERYLTGCVTDYFEFFGLFHFNLPDVLITIGVVIYLASILWVRELNKD